MTSAGPNGLLGVCMGTQFAQYASGYPRQLAYWPPTGYPPSPVGGPYYAAHSGRSRLHHGRYGSRYWGETPCQATLTSPAYMLVKPAGCEENRAEQVEHHACHQQCPTGIISDNVTITGGRSRRRQPYNRAACRCGSRKLTARGTGAAQTVGTR
jgi:hypothetical protein